MVGITPPVEAAEQLRQLPDNFADNADFGECVAAIRRGEPVTFDSVWGSACALLVACLARRFENILVVCPDHKSQDDLLDDLATFCDSPSERFPACLAVTDSSVSADQDYGERLRLLKRCSRGRVQPIVVSSIQALMQPVPHPGSISEHSRFLRCGQTLDIQSFVKWLVVHRFHQTSAVELPGEFSVRAGIIDLFAPDWAGPVRVELFDDEIESLRHFEIGTQRSVQDLHELEITVFPPEIKDKGNFVEYLPRDAVILQIEPEQLQQQAKTYFERSSSSENLFAWNDVAAYWSSFPSATAAPLATGRFETHWQMPVDSIGRFSGDIGNIRVEVDRTGGDADVFVVARVEGEIDRVREILNTTKIAMAGRLHLSMGCVHAGFRLRNLNCVVIGCDQLFHRGELRRTTRRRLGKAIDSFMDLREGDLVVHLAHGIARFRGLKMLDKDGQHTEHLELEFYGGTRIFVPASKIDLVQKYIGGAKTRPTLARIGGKSWQRQKQAAAEAVTDLAAEMIELQAARKSRPGIAFSCDTQWQHEFEQSFPYRETPDQLAAIEAIKDDMQTARPMDRLLCGDVGYGKTEVAMRAAFKAVENGYQVAVLVPTTILAEQHFHTFTARMIEFPLEIGKLSRFCSSSELRQTIEQLKSGQVDIVIGTHRLVSKDVEFCNLGLVVIDEEQRFGVAHKERLKSLRKTVDVLTMSATPIPRTLHMSLVGLRDISNLESPPEDRIAVETKVSRFNAQVIREAILREMNRAGQTYFVHNRVNDIHVVRQQLESIVPEATIAVGHGQMPEVQLERVMTEFIAGKFDVLLATTIIESGLDIPNANTIFVDQADRYGLSDLHQLRGRVGRYKHRAYCYLLLPPNKHLNPTAAKRLQAIETFSDMGAGFAIAMRDLEIRGAGNLLGTQQSGHIAAIGYELYCQLLENAVRQLQKKPAKIALDVDIDLPLSAYLPDDYVIDRRQKIDLYRRLARLEKFDQIAEFKSELRDRFGPLPPPAKRLLSLSQLKLEAAVWQIQSIFIEDRYLGFRYQNRSRIQQLAKMKKGIVRVVDEKTAYVTLKAGANDPNKLLALVKTLLRADS